MRARIGQSTLATPETWRAAARRLAEGEATLASLWGDEGGMRMAMTKVGEAHHVLDFA